jgi:phage shock protein C
MSEQKRLYRSQDDRMIAGVCAGLAEYMDVDPTLVRLAMVGVTLVGGSGFLVYVIAWIIMPERPEETPNV